MYIYIYLKKQPIFQRGTPSARLIFNSMFVVDIYMGMVKGNHKVGYN